jgi:hypothetical protein
VNAGNLSEFKYRLQFWLCSTASGPTQRYATFVGAGIEKPNGDLVIEVTANTCAGQRQATLNLVKQNSN